MIQTNAVRFQEASNIACSISFASNMLRRRFPWAALIDLTKTYEIVPRDIPQEMLERRTPLRAELHDPPTSTAYEDQD